MRFGIDTKKAVSESPNDVREFLEKDVGFVTDGMPELVAEIVQASHRKDALLIVGESGTGKELVARSINALKKRNGDEGIYGAVNCATFSKDVIESELFGHEKGSFTGAQNAHRGLIEYHDKGRLFLDEIGELSRELQVKLFRAIEYGEIRPVGGNETRIVDVQFLSATSAKDIDDVRSKLRDELYYRLAASSIEIPSLRDRSELAKKRIIYNALRSAHEKFDYNLNGVEFRIDDDLLEDLIGLEYPGNVRQCNNVVTSVVGQALAERQNDERVVQLHKGHLTEKIRRQASKNEGGN